MKKLLLYLSFVTGMVMALITTNSASAQNVTFTANFNWPAWAGENCFTLVAPDGTSIGCFCAGANCLNGANVSYFATNMGLGTLPYSCGNYTIVRYEQYGDGWNTTTGNPTANVTIYANGVLIGTYGNTCSGAGCTQSSTFTLPSSVLLSCNIAPETTGAFTAPSALSACSNGTINLGSGAYRDITLEPNTYYDFTNWANNTGGTISGFCATVQSGTGHSGNFSGPVNNWYSGSTATVLRVSANRTSCTWSATSAVMTYRRTTPTLTANSPTGSVNGCAGTPVSITGGTATWGTRYWQNTISSGVSTATPGSPNNVSATGTYYYRPNNSGCWGTQQATTVTVNPLPVDGSIAQTPTATPICLGQSITATPTGGTGTPYYWVESPIGAGWNVFAQASANAPGNGFTFTPAAAGTYRVHARWNTLCGFCWDTPGGCTMNPYFDVVVSAPSVGGTASSNQTICSGQTPANLTVGGITGGVTMWQWSTNAAFTIPNNIASSNSTTLTSALMGPLSANRYYRAVVQSGTCAVAYSTVVTITVDPTTVGGTVGNSHAICAGSPSTTLNLTGHTGTVQNWEFSINGGANWTTIANTTTSHNAGSPTQTTMYRAVVKSGTCPAVNSAAATITVNAPTINIGPAMSPICQGGTTPGLGASFGGSSTGLSWSSSAGGSFSSNTDPNAQFTPPANYWGNITVTATSTGGSCLPAATASKTIFVQRKPIIGSISASQLMCVGSIPNPLVVSGLGAGTTVSGWRSSPNGSTGWTPIANLTTTYAPGPTAAGTLYYSILVDSGVCVNVASSNVTISATTPANTLATNGMTRTCRVNSNQPVLFVDQATGRFIGYMNSGGADWGLVDMTVYVSGTPLAVQACGTGQLQFNSAVLGRHWTASSTLNPGGTITAGLPFDNTTEFVPLSTASLANTNPNDNLGTNDIPQLELSKYDNFSTPSYEDNTWSNNCYPTENDTVTLHLQSSAHTSVSSVIPGFNASANMVYYNIPGFSELWLSGTNNVSPLPIELLSFKPTCVEGRVVVEWVTATEINNEKFVIERSANLQDWEILAIVPGAGNSNQPLEYSIVDERPIDDTSYYRLTQYDYDGANESFDPEGVTCYGNDMFKLYPNPTNTGSFQIEFSLDVNHSGIIDVISIDGKSIYSRRINGTGESKIYTIVTHGWNPGPYFVSVFDGNKRRFEKVIVQ